MEGGTRMGAVLPGNPTRAVPHDLTFDGEPSAMRLVVEIYARLLLAGAAVVPAILIGYLFFFQDPGLRFEDHWFHVIAITAATLEGLFVAYVAWRCYQSSGEPLLRWMTLGFLGFTLIYMLHGAFTRMAHQNVWLFLLYGPASRLVMSVLLFIALLSYCHPPDAELQRSKSHNWFKWIGLFLLIDLAVAYLAHSPIAGDLLVRLSMEGGALVFSMASVVALLLRRTRSPLMAIFAIAVTAFAWSSLAFILALPWNHMWWLAHVIFASGFFLLSYGVVRAFLTTRSFSTIYSHEELMARLGKAKAATEVALEELQRTNEALELLAATDPLTGVDNRRRFVEHVDAEIRRVERGGAEFCVLALDLDNFKLVNDRYGHQVGDDVLKEFVRICVDAIRPYDGIARIGGEEFMVLLPQAGLETARVVAERLRSAVEGGAYKSGAHQLTSITVSVGIAQSGQDGDNIEEILRTADQRLYKAKHQGRNQVVSV